MTYSERIASLWDQTGDKDLATVLKEIIELVDAAYTAEETLPAELELEILLNANYAIGFGGTVSEARTIALLLNRILEEDISLPSSKVHRLACTLASAVISLMTSDVHHSTKTTHDIIVWDQFDTTTEFGILLGSLTERLIKALAYGDFNSWKLELFSFIITLLLIQQDLSQLQIPPEVIDDLSTKIQEFPTSSSEWVQWENEWLEKSDYYRFVTLMLTNTSVDEDIWLDIVKNCQTKGLSPYFGQ